MSQKDLASLLDLDQCKEIVNKINQETKNCQLQVQSFEVNAATEVKGFLAEYFHLTVQCNEQRHHENELNNLVEESAAILLKFFVKNLPSSDEYDERAEIFSKESSLYSSLLLKLQKYSTKAWCPRVYFRSRNILVMEDLHNHGLDNPASKDTLTENEMYPVLNGLAAMHAASLLYEFETGDIIGNTYSEHLKEITVQHDIPWFSTGLKAILDIIKRQPKYQTAALQASIISKLPLCLNNVFNMVNPSSKYRNVLCHRDPWGGNIFLNSKNPNQPAVFVDFQTCRYSPAAIDVIFALFMNLSKLERMERSRDYITYYYQQLVEHVTKHISNNILLNRIIFSEEELFESIEEFMLFGFVYRALAITILKVPTELVTDYYKNVERSEILLQYMQEDEEFSCLMEESVDDIIDAVTGD